MLLNSHSFIHSFIQWLHSSDVIGLIIVACVETLFQLSYEIGIIDTSPSDSTTVQQHTQASVSQLNHSLQRLNMWSRDSVLQDASPLIYPGKLSVPCGSRPSAAWQTRRLDPLLVRRWPSIEPTPDLRLVSASLPMRRQAALLKLQYLKL